MDCGRSKRRDRGTAYVHQGGLEAGDSVQVQCLKLQTCCFRKEVPRHWRADVLAFSGTVPTLRQLMSAYTEQAVESEVEEPRFVRMPEATRVPGVNGRRLDRLAELYETEFPE